MRRDLLEAFIGKKVQITLFDKSTYTGTLKLGNGFFEQPKMYHIAEEPIAFRCSHVIKCIEFTRET
jgi:hypothetical protein